MRTMAWVSDLSNKKIFQHNNLYQICAVFSKCVAIKMIIYARDTYGCPSKRAQVDGGRWYQHESRPTNFKFPKFHFVYNGRVTRVGRLSWYVNCLVALAGCWYRKRWRWRAAKQSATLSCRKISCLAEANNIFVTLMWGSTANISTRTSYYSACWV